MFCIGIDAVTESFYLQSGLSVQQFGIHLTDALEVDVSVLQIKKECVLSKNLGQPALKDKPPNVDSPQPILSIGITHAKVTTQLILSYDSRDSTLVSEDFKFMVGWNVIEMALDGREVKPGQTS